MVNKKFKIGEVEITKLDKDYKIVKGEIEQVIDYDLIYGISRFVLNDLINEKDMQIETYKNAQFVFAELETQRQKTEKENEKLVKKCEELQQRYYSFIEDFRKVSMALVENIKKQEFEIIREEYD